MKLLMFYRTYQPFGPVDLPSLQDRHAAAFFQQLARGRQASLVDVSPGLTGFVCYAVTVAMKTHDVTMFLGLALLDSFVGMFQGALGCFVVCSMMFPLVSFCCQVFPLDQLLLLVSAKEPGRRRQSPPSWT